MSKAPNGDVKSYVGDGDWFKIAESAPEYVPDMQIWNTWNWPMIETWGVRQNKGFFSRQLWAGTHCGL
jgi:hypothetical protein